MTTLYHGSNTEIVNIDLSRSRRGKDFGCGFYLNANRQQAQDMAERTVERTATGLPVVSAFAFDESNLTGNKDIRVKIFEDYSEEWAQFVLANRRYKEEGNSEGYDIVVGPIANDTIGVQFHRYLLGYIDIRQMIEELRFRGNRAIQYYFGTPKAVALLKKI